MDNQQWAAFIGLVLAPFGAVLLGFVARVIIKKVNPHITNPFVRKILFIRW